MDYKDEKKQICEPSCDCYDIVLDNGQYRIDEYKTMLVATYQDGKRRVNRVYEQKGEIYPLDLELAVKRYREKGYRSANEFRNYFFVNEVVCNNPLLKLKLLVLEQSCKILEKLYEITRINGEEYIITYLNLVNLNTGKIHFIKMDKMPYNEVNMRLLEDKDYQRIEDSKIILKDSQEVNKKNTIRVRTRLK